MTAANDDRADDYFGLCPTCHSTDGYLNLRSNHIFLCDAHKVAWPIGSNLFSAWRDETEADWDRNRQKLADYREIEPFYWPETLAERAADAASLGDSGQVPF